MGTKKEKENFLQSRRAWAAAFMLIIAILSGFVELGYIPEDIIKAFTPVLSLLAGFLGIASWKYPK